MNETQLPLTHPWTLAFVAHSEDRVIVHLSARTWECLTLAQDYVLDSAAFDAKLTNGGGVAYYIRPERWIACCQKVALAQQDPGQAIFDAWLEWTAGDAPPPTDADGSNRFARAFMKEYAEMMAKFNAIGGRDLNLLHPEFNYPQHNLGGEHV